MENRQPRNEIEIRDGQRNSFYPNRKRSEFELFDLSSDSAEKINLFDERPEIDKRLTTNVEPWKASLPGEYITADNKN